MSIFASLLLLQSSTYIWDRFGLLIMAGFTIFIVASMWTVFEKAGQPGWAAIIPLYQQIVMARIGQKSAWWIVALFVPGLNVVALFALSIGVADRFEKGAGYGIGLTLLPFIFYPLLAWSDAEATPVYA